MAPQYDQRSFARRSSDEWRFWIQLCISVSTSALMLGIIYGKLDGRLQLIEYRLHRIEVVLKLEN